MSRGYLSFRAAISYPLALILLHGFLNFSHASNKFFEVPARQPVEGSVLRYPRYWCFRPLGLLFVLCNIGLIFLALQMAFLIHLHLLQRPRTGFPYKSGHFFWKEHYNLPIRIFFSKWVSVYWFPNALIRNASWWKRLTYSAKGLTSPCLIKASLEAALSWVEA